nr:hypothetical protein [Tanacetum cinerariifolium]
MNELVNNGIKISKIKINTGFINGLPKKWLSFYQSLRNTNHVKESELAYLFGKLKYEENLINSIYDTNKEKILVPATPQSTAFFSTSMVQDFEDSLKDEEDTISSQEYMNDLKEEYQARALLANLKGSSKRVLKDLAVQKQLTKLNAINMARRVILQETVGQRHQFLHISHLFNQNFSIDLSTNLNQHTKDFKAKYNKVKAKLALLNSSASAPSSSMCKNKGLITKMYDWDEEVSYDDNEVNEVKALMALADEERVSVGKKSTKNGKWFKISMKKKILGIKQPTEDTFSFRPKDLIFVKSSANNVSITYSNQPRLYEVENSTLSNHDTGKISTVESQRNTTDPSVDVIESSATNYDSIDESLVYSTPLPPLKKLDSVEPVFGPKTIKSILKSKSTFKDETLKGIIINEPSSAPDRGNKSSLASKANLAHTSKLKNVKIEDDTPLAIVIKELNELKLQISKKSHLTSKKYSIAIPSLSCIHCGYNDHKSDDYVYYPICKIYGRYDHETYGHNRIISLKRGIKPKNPQYVTKNYKTYDSNVLTTPDHNDIEWFKKREALNANKANSFKASKTVSSSALRSKTPTKRLYEVENSTLSNHDTGKISTVESQRNTTDPSVDVIESSATNYDSIDESLVYSTPLPPLKKLDSVEPVFGPKTIKSILKSKSTFKDETLKGIIINEPSSAPDRGNKSSLASKANLARTSKLKNVKIEDDTPLAIVIKELNELKLQISKKSHLTSKKYSIAIPSLSCIHCGYNDHKSDDYVYYPICKIYGRYDHETYGHNRIISLKRGIKPKNPQYVTKNYKTYDSNVLTTPDHNDIEWFKKREALNANKANSFKASKTVSSSALRSKTPTKRRILFFSIRSLSESHIVRSNAANVEDQLEFFLQCAWLFMRYMKCSLFKKVGAGKDQKNDDDFVAPEYLNEYSRELTKAV